MSRPQVRDLNENLVCFLCKGYLIDATTIVECLHSFCRSCIVRYLEKNKYCPVCDVQVHKNKPLLNIRSDLILQDVVYKLVPGLYQSEIKRRREFNKQLQPSSTARPADVGGNARIYSPEESFCLSLQYEGGGGEGRRYLKCPAALPVAHLQKLLRGKYGLGAGHRVEILHQDQVLSDALTLMDVAYIYLWKRKGPLRLTYRILKEGKAKEKPQPAKKVGWKEVQLQISESWVMSVTDVPAKAEDPKKKPAEEDPKETKKPAEEAKKEPKPPPIEKLSEKHPLKKYKTLRDPPRAWNPQQLRASINEPGTSSSTSSSSSSPARPPKFFKVRHSSSSTSSSSKEGELKIAQSTVSIFSPLRQRRERPPPLMGYTPPSPFASRPPFPPLDMFSLFPPYRMPPPDLLRPPSSRPPRP